MRVLGRSAWPGHCLVPPPPPATPGWEAAEVERGHCPPRIYGGFWQWLWGTGPECGMGPLGLTCSSLRVYFERPEEGPPDPFSKLGSVGGLGHAVECPGRVRLPMAGPWSTTWGQGLWMCVTQGSVITGGVICFSRRVGLGGQDPGRWRSMWRKPRVSGSGPALSLTGGVILARPCLSECFYLHDCPLRCSVASENPCVSLKKNPVPASHVRPTVLTLEGVGSEACSLVWEAHLSFHQTSLSHSANI